MSLALGVTNEGHCASGPAAGLITRDLLLVSPLRF